MAYNVTTEWDDIQVKNGNYKPHEHVDSNDQVMFDQLEQLECYDKRRVMNDRQIKEMAEDDLDFDDEDDFMKEYKAKRMAQMKESAARPKFGEVLEITKQDWEYHVTRAPTDVWVIVVLYQNQ